MILRLFRDSYAFCILCLLAVFFSQSVTTVFAQDTNVCRDFPTAIDIEYGDAVEGSINDLEAFQFFCFEAERGDEVTVTLEPFSGSLIAQVVISTPFITSEFEFSDEPLGGVAATSLGGDVDLTVNIDEDGTYLITVIGLEETTGNFDLELERETATLSGGNNSDDNEDEEDDPETIDEDDGDEGIAVNEFIPGQDNFCNIEDIIDVTTGELAEAEIDSGSPIAFTAVFCLEAEEDEVLRIEATTVDGDAQLIFIVADAFSDLQPDDVLAQGVANDSDEPAVTELVVPDDGEYVILVFAVNEEDGDIELLVTQSDGSSSAVVPTFDCQAEPLSMVTAVSWGITDADSNTRLVGLDVGCNGLFALSALNVPNVGAYEITEDGSLNLFVEGQMFETVSLGETEWVLMNEDGAELTFVPVNDPEACAVEEQRALIEGLWRWDIDNSQTVIFDFTCGGFVILETPTDFFAVPYVYSIEDETITIDLGDEPLVFEDVEVEEDELEVEIDGDNMDFPNLNYVEPED